MNRVSRIWIVAPLVAVLGVVAGLGAARAAANSSVHTSPGQPATSSTSTTVAGRRDSGTVTAKAVPMVVRVGERYTFRFSVKNTGSASGDFDVVVGEPPDPVAGGDCVEAGGSIQCHIRGLGPGATASRSISFIASRPGTVTESVILYGGKGQYVVDQGSVTVSVEEQATSPSTTTTVAPGSAGSTTQAPSSQNGGALPFTG